VTFRKTSRTLGQVTIGMAAVTAFQAYNDSSMLTAAEQAWNGVAPYQISQAQAARRKTPVKSFSFDSQCNGGERHCRLRANITSLSASQLRSWVEYLLCVSIFTSVPIADADVDFPAKRHRYRHGCLKVSASLSRLYPIAHHSM
jgi:hypothetical protein